MSKYHRAIFGDADVMRYLPPSALPPLERTETAINRRNQHWQDYGFGLWAIDLRSDGKLIGHCGLQHLESTAEIEIAYALAKPYWGRGLATEAARAALKFGFEEIQLDRIVAIAMPANVTSQRVMQKLGMTYEKSAWYYNNEMVYYAITREEYQAMINGQ